MWRAFLLFVLLRMKDKTYWIFATVTVLVGLGGFPFSYWVGSKTESFLYMGLCAAAALVFIFACQNFLRDERSWRFRLFGLLGVALVFLWAPLVLVWCFMIVLLMPKAK